ncbi:MAG: proline--tRNA ligase [Candidatus Methylopumilus sp.]|nr:proline--tRNA ligase [Candidatus Methylopumilus sp.]
MLASKFYLSTLKEAPSEAELISHKLMIRAGFIKRLGSGLYSWMPLGLKVLRKIEAIIRNEMNQAGAVELLMPAIQPAELWEETDRWELFGPQMLKIKDRHDRNFCFGPTHEEVITDIARKEINSYKQLPINFYQIQMKFRDEIRPRFGVMRAREFLMKDAYSFHASKISLQETYERMYQTYTNIFNRIGLKFRAVKADTGAIGGDGSHEFHVLADSGEDAIAYSSESDYAANIELAEAILNNDKRSDAQESMVKFNTPKQTTCDDVASLIGASVQRTVKTIALINHVHDKYEFFLVLLRGDHELNEVKLSKVKGFENFRFATDEEIKEHLKCPPGFIGPVGVKPSIKIMADKSVGILSDFICGANESKFHLRGVNFVRDLPEPYFYGDFRKVVEGDISPDNQGTLKICRGIEVGHIFQLGNKYSKAMKAEYLDEHGQTQILEMGCYGIGVSRIVAAAIEQSHDDRGMIFPVNIAPFEVVIVPIGYDKSDEVKASTHKIYDALYEMGADVFLDDRGERPGIMFAEMELIGIPYRIVIGDRNLKEGKVEFQGRLDQESKLIDINQIVKEIKSLLSL